MAKPQDPLPRSLRALEIPMLCLLAALPLIATVARLWRSWVPVGDSAAITLRAHDVFSAHTPLIGMPTTLSDSVGQTLHHPGPIEFWAIAVARLIWDHPATPMLAVVAVNLAAVCAIVFLAARLGGRHAALLAAVITGLACWSLRGDFLVDPYNPYAAWLPLGAGLVATAASVAGLRWAPVVAVLGLSYAAQSHVSLLGPVGLAVLVAAAAGFMVLRAGGEPFWPPPAQVRRPILVAAGAALACWAPVLVDLAFGSRNLATLFGATASDEPVLGMSRAFGVVVRAVTSPPWLEAQRDGYEMVAPVGAWQVLGFVTMLAVAGAVAAALWRRNRAVGALLAFAVAGLVGGAVAASRIPFGIFNAFALHNFLWTWPLSAMFWAGLLSGLALIARASAESAGTDLRVARAATGFALVAALCAVGTVGALGEPPRSSVLAGRHARSTADLAAALEGSLEPGGTYLVLVEAELDQSAVAMGLVLALERAGFEALVEAGLSDSFGSHRTLDGQTLDGTLLVVVGSRDAAVGAEAELVASSVPDQDAVADLEAVKAEVMDSIGAAGGLILAVEGREENDAAETLRLVSSGELIGLHRLGVIASPELPDSLYRRYQRALEGPVLEARVYLLPAPAS